MFKSLRQFNYLRMPLVEQELLILPEKMSSPKVLMGFILLDLQLPVSWEGGGIPPFISVHEVDRYFSDQWNFEGASCSKILLKSTPDVREYMTQIKMTDTITLSKHNELDVIKYIVLLLRSISFGGFFQRGAKWQPFYYCNTAFVHFFLAVFMFKNFATGMIS